MRNDLSSDLILGESSSISSIIFKNCNLTLFYPYIKNLSNPDLNIQFINSFDSEDKTITKEEYQKIVNFKKSITNKFPKRCFIF